MQRNVALTMKIAGITLAVFLIVFYAYIQSKTLLSGPRVDIFEPKNGSQLAAQIIMIKGEARNISHISLNDAQIFVNEEGSFAEKLLLNPGYNVITVKARDRFGRTDEKKLEVVYEGKAERLSERSGDKLPPEIGSTTPTTGGPGSLQ